MPVRPHIDKATVGVWSVFTQFFTKNVTQPFRNYLHNRHQAAALEFPKIIADATKDLQPITDAVKTAFQVTGKAMADALDPTFGALANDVFNAAAVNLTAAGESTPDGALAEASKAYAQAFGFGMSSAAVTAVFEMLVPEKLNTLNGVGPMLAKMAGFDEVAEGVLEPLYENAFGQSLKYHFKSVFKPEFASEMDAVKWHSRRLMSEDDLREIFKYSGLKAKYEPAYVASAYRPVQPRAIATMIVDTPFPTAEMHSLLEFGGYRDQDLALLLRLMEHNSLKNVRQQYLAAAIRAANLGNIDTPTLDSHLDGLDFSVQAKNFVHLTVSLNRLDQLGELYRKQVSTLYLTNQLTDAQYIPALEAIGVGAPDANAHYGEDSAKKHGRELLAQERAAAALASKETSLTLNTTRVEYLAGAIGDVEMAAAIAASGLPGTLVPGTIANLAAQLAARRVDKFGKLTDHAGALLLAEKVAALKEQAIKKIGTPASWTDTLKSMGIPDANVQALVSEWAAQALKTQLPV